MNMLVSFSTTCFLCHVSVVIAYVHNYCCIPVYVANGLFDDGESRPPREVYIPPAPPEDEGSIFATLDAGINFDKYDEIPVEVSGRASRDQQPIHSFEGANLYETLRENVRKSNYLRPTPIQKYAIPIILAGRDVMACAQTGSGKTVSLSVAGQLHTVYLQKGYPVLWTGYLTAVLPNARTEHFVLSACAYMMYVV